MVSKFENLKADGNYKPFWGSSHRQCGTKKYKGYEAYIYARHFETEEEANIAFKSLHQDWKDSIDEQEKQKNNPTSSSNSEGKQNVETNEVPVTESETTKLTKQVGDIVRDKIKPLELKEKELRAIAERIEKENQERVDKINQQVEKQNEENVKLLQEANKARGNNDKAQTAKMVALLQEGQKKAAEFNNQKKDLVTKDDIMKMLTAHAKPWYQKINYKDPWLYGKFFLLILVIILIIWLIKKALSYFMKK